jgi:nitrogen fixation NifU-like protein
MNFYHDVLLDHFRHSRYRGTLENPDFLTNTANPSCGDTVTFQGRVKEGMLIELAFTGSGCVISQAAASLLVQASKGKSVGMLMAYNAAFMRSLVGIELGPTRLRCALLSLEALQAGAQLYA